MGCWSNVDSNQIEGVRGVKLEARMVGDWSDLWLGMRLDLTLRPLVKRYADVNQIAFLALLRADVKIAHGASFHVTRGISTIYYTTCCLSVLATRSRQSHRWNQNALLVVALWLAGCFFVMKARESSGQVPLGWARSPARDIKMGRD